MIVTLTWITSGWADVSYADASPASIAPTVIAQANSAGLPDGNYPLQQATYDDIDGSYSLMLLNTPAGRSSVFRSDNLPMARLTDAELAANQKSYLQVEKGQPSLHLAEDFRIEYVHNVTETQANPQTGQPEVVVVRQEPSFWTPFAGALAGQALGSLLFMPHYYFPPVYHPGGVLTGYGGYGRTYNRAVESYRATNKTVPTAVRNQRLRTTGQLKTSTQSKTNRPAANRPKANRAKPAPFSNRPSGSGYGSSSLRRTNTPGAARARSGASKFGSSRFGSGGRARSFSGGRRR